MRIAVVFDSPYPRYTPEDHHRQMTEELGADAEREPDMEYQVAHALEARGHEVLLIGVSKDPREVLDR